MAVCFRNSTRLNLHSFLNVTKPVPAGNHVKTEWCRVASSMYTKDNANSDTP